MDGRLPQLLNDYITLERRIQQLIGPVTCQFCADCAACCCREEICRESLSSPFLAALTARQNLPYDRRRGWLGPAGCRLEYGRPLVCYDFFCRRILNSPSFKTAGIQTLIRDFAAIGNRACGSTHLVCISDLDMLSKGKMKKIFHNIHTLLQRM